MNREDRKMRKNKVLTWAVIFAMVVSVFGCSKKPDNGGGNRGIETIDEECKPENGVSLSGTVDPATYGDADVTELVDFMYSLTGEDINTAVRMTEEFFGVVLVDYLEMISTENNETTKDRCYYQLVEWKGITFTWLYIGCTMGSEKVCKIRFEDSIDDHESVNKEEFTGKITAFWDDTHNVFREHYGSPIFSDDYSEEPGEIWLFTGYQYNSTCTIELRCRVLTNGCVSGEFIFRNTEYLG